MLRIEKSENCSGKIFNETKIKVLKNTNFRVLDLPLDGDAPKQFIYVYEYSKKSNVKKQNKNTWIPYIAKTAEKWYPHESVVEYMINRIGQTLGLSMNEVALVKANKQIRFLSKYFLNSKIEKLVHGAEICGEYLGDMPKAEEIANDKAQAREIFTFEFIKEAIRKVFPNDFEKLTYEFVKMLVFDAIVGNNDRHFYNWGVIQNVKSTNKSVTFAPLYDSARGLLWNFSEENISKHLDAYTKQSGTKIEKYINGSKPRVSIEDNKEANHFELVDFIGRYNDEFKEIALSLTSYKKEEEVFRMLENEIFIYFSQIRRDLIKIVLKERFNKIRKIV